MKKLFAILFSIIFLIQVLPIKQWMSNYGKASISVEMTDNTDSNEKNNTEKEIKEDILFQNQSLNWQISKKINRLNILTSQNAIILHHSEVSAPPPDFI